MCVVPGINRAMSQAADPRIWFKQVEENGAWFNRWVAKDKAEVWSIVGATRTII